MSWLRSCAFILMMLSAVMLQACGNGGAGSNTNGTLSMSELTVADQTGGNFLVTGSATYAPPAGKVTNGAQIMISSQFNTAGGTPTTKSNTVTLDSTGVASFSYFVVQANEPVFVTVTASIGDLHNSKSSTVPANSPLSVTPSVLAFTATEVAGTTKTLTINGGISPFTVASSNTADISATVNGTVVSVAIIKSPSVGQKSATVTVKDLRGSSIDIPVSYF